MCAVPHCGRADKRCSFDGQLTPETIEDMLGDGASALQPLLDLSLQGRGLREMVAGVGALFSMLQCLNLSDNSLVSFAALAALPSLRALNLNNNRIQRLADDAYALMYRCQPLTRRSDTKRDGKDVLPVFAKLEVLHLGSYACTARPSLMRAQRATALRI